MSSLSLRNLEQVREQADIDAQNVAPRVMVIMPAYHAARTLAATVRDIPEKYVAEILLVDDASHDETVAIAESLGLTVRVSHENRGYGASQKTGYGYALQTDAQVVAMLHPDYQYDARVLPAAVELIRLGIVDVVVGSRIRTRREALRGGMPWIKYLANRLLTTIQNISLGQNLGDFHSGFRVFRREILESIRFEDNSDDFLFDGQFLIQCIERGFRLGDIPVPVRYFDEASSISYRRSVVYALGSLWWIVRYYLHRLRIVPATIFQPKCRTHLPVADPHARLDQSISATDSVQGVERHPS